MLVLIVSCVILKVCSSSSVTCEIGWIEYRGRCYYFSEEHSDTRDNAIGFCKKRGSYLVSVTDTDINNFLFRQRTHNDNYWIGLKAFPAHSWGWNDGTTVNDINWGGNPVSGQACAYYVNNKFYEYGCHDRIVWSLCEKDTEPSNSQDWTQFEGHWYRAKHGYTSQLYAASACITDGGYLARVTSNAEKSFVSSQTESTNVWTGLTRLVWDDGSGYNWHAFSGTGQDYPTDSSCTALGKGNGESKEWKTSGCGGWNRFICAHAPLTSTNQPTTTISEPTKATTSTEFTTITTRTTSTSAPSTTTSMTTPSTNPATTQTSSVTSTIKAIERSTTLTSTHQPTEHTTGQTQKTSSSNAPFYETSEVTSTTDTSSQFISESLEELNSPEDGALLYVMCVIYSLIAVMLAIDLVLLGVFLKMRKNSMNNFDDISPGLCENTLLNSKTEVQSQYYGADVQAHAADPFPIYAMPTKPQTKPKPTATRLNRTSDQDDKDDLSSDITGRNTNFPVYAVPSKRRSHDPDL